MAHSTKKQVNSSSVFSPVFSLLPRPLRTRVERCENCIVVSLVLLLVSLFAWYEFSMVTNWGEVQLTALHTNGSALNVSTSQLWMAPSEKPGFVVYDLHPKKIAFLFFAQQNLLLAPLWDKFFRGHENLYSIYINLNPGHSLNNLPETFKDAQQFHYEYNSGNSGLMDAEVGLLTHALRDQANDRFVFLSESCIPAYGFPFFYQYLMNSSLSYVDIITNQRALDYSRYSDCLSPVVPREAWTKGSPWMAMGYEVALLIVSDKQYFSKFKECSLSKPNTYPDEHYIQSLLRNTAPHLLANRTLTWAYWAGGPSPHSFDHIEPGIINSIRYKKCTWNGMPNSPCHLIAREFTPDALPSLLQFSNELGF